MGLLQVTQQVVTELDRRPLPRPGKVKWHLKGAQTSSSGSSPDLSSVRLVRPGLQPGPQRAAEYGKKGRIRTWWCKGTLVAGEAPS